MMFDNLTIPIQHIYVSLPKDAINQSIIQSTNQSTNQPINRSFNQSINQPEDVYVTFRFICWKSTKESVNRAPITRC